MLIDLFGIMGTSIGISMYIPQILKVLKTKKVDDLSKSSFTIIMLGMLGWMFFGATNRDFLPWLVNFVISQMMFVMIWYLYGGRKSIPVIIGFLLGHIVSLLFLTVIRVYPSDLMNSVIIFLSGISTGTGLYFQWFKVMKTKRTRDVSIIMLFLILFNQSIWVARWALMLDEKFEVARVLCIVFSGLPIISASGLIACKILIKEPNPILM